MEKWFIQIIRCGRRIMVAKAVLGVRKTTTFNSQTTNVSDHS